MNEIIDKYKKYKKELAIIIAYEAAIIAISIVSFAQR